jgi:Helix-turn-helix.
MVFSDLLNQYMNELGCTAKYLSQETGISMTKISRYRNGHIVPTTNMDVAAKMAKVFSSLAAAKNISSMTEEKIYENLISALDDEFDHEAFKDKLNILIEVFGINITKLAKFCNYNVSTISKVRLGQRKLRDPLYMAHCISDYVIRFYKEKQI